MSGVQWSARTPIVVGFAAVIVLFAAIGIWGVRSQIAGAVIAPGAIDVENERQVVQHPDGGVVSRIAVRDGDRVASGDVLIELDSTFLQAELAVIEGQLVEIYARSARLRAERDGLRVFEFGEAPILQTVAKRDLDELMSGQKALFVARFNRLTLEDNQFTTQQDQIRQQIAAFESQQLAIQKQLELIREEIADVETLFSQGLVQAGRLRELRRAEAELQGDTGALEAQIAEANTRISELEIEKSRLIDAHRENAIVELRDLALSERELSERKRSLTEQLGRLQIVAPVSGTVFGSRVAAERSVVQPAEPVMYIVPGDQPLRVVAEVAPTDVDQVFSGQEVALVFSAFSQRNMPEGRGSVLRVSADAEVNEVTGMSFYEAVILIDPETETALSGRRLLPGMPVEAYIETDKRTPLTYLVQPLTTYFSRAFREE